MLGGGDLDGDVSKQLELSNHRFFLLTNCHNEPQIDIGTLCKGMFTLNSYEGLAQ